MPNNTDCNCDKNNSKRAFTLVEVLTALFLVMTGIGSGYALINQSLAASNSASIEITAAYLGKEGIEIARNIRDSNYLKILYSEDGYDGDTAWRSGLYCLPSDDCSVNTDCEDGCAADYSSEELSTAHLGDKLRYDAGGGFFGYSTGSESLYERTITVVPEDDYLKVSVLVEWSDRGRGRTLTVEENLYNWWPQ